MNELQAAYGLLQLKSVDNYILQRKVVTELYRQYLRDVSGIAFFDDISGIDHNYAYFPITVDVKKYGRSRDELYEKLKSHNIFGRRYFYPLISQFPTYRGLASSSQYNLPVATQIANQILCLVFAR